MIEISNLESNELFKGLSSKEIESLLSEVKYSTVTYNKGEIMFQEGDKCNNIGLIISGCIQIERIYESGKEIVLKKLCEGDVFGEALIFSKQNLYPATVIAKSNCKIFYINKKEIISLCSNNEIILENFMSLLSEKVIMLNNKVKSIALKSIKNKVSHYIIERSKKVDGNTINLNESKEEIAAYLGIPRPSLSRELINLRNEGIIEFDRKKICILDKEKLEEKLFD